MICDIVIGIQAGDEAKGKVTHHLLKNGKHSCVARFNGSGNAGHTIYHQGKKFITHLIPAGVFYGIKSVIGTGCLIHPKSFFEELNYLKENGINCDGLVKVSKKAHIITDQHIEEDSKDTKIGTTKRGVGPAAASRANRTGIQAKQVSELQEYLVDFYEEVVNKDHYVLFEGAQGYDLDLNSDSYPYCTSTYCGTSGVLLNEVPFSSIKKVYGVCKGYSTYVGAMKFQPEGEIFNKIQELGGEVGSTTGRKRQVNFLDMDKLKKAIHINDVNELIVNKMDVLQEVNCFKILVNNQVVDLKTELGFIEFIHQSVPPNVNVRFSYSPEKI